MSLGTLIVIVAVILVAAVCVAVVLALRGSGTGLRFDIGGQAPRASGGNDTSPETSFKSRITGLGFFSGGVLALLLGKLWSMQLVSSDDYARQADSNRTRTVTSVAPRGRILDRNGVELVTNRPSLTVTATADVADDAVELALLANLLGMPAVACKRKVQNANEGAQSARTIAVDASRRAVAYLQEHADLFAGVRVEERTQRLYPQGLLACHLLGYTGTVTSEQIEGSSGGEGISYESGDTAGQSGIEYQYEGVLQGVRGEQTVYVDANGNVTSYSTNVPAESGSDVVLTIDAKIQRGAEEGLAHGIEMAKKNYEGCDSGAVVVLDATNGEVLAMASAPTFDPEVFVGGISQDDWEALSSEKAHNPLMNRAVTGQFVAASTIKPLTTFAALDYGIATPDSSFMCAGYWTGFGADYGKWCWNHDGHGPMTLQTGITYSCDVVFYEVAKGFYQSSQPDGMQETFRKWGLGSPIGIDLPSESSGIIPDAEWKWNAFEGYDEAQRTWQGGDYTNIAIGQGDITVTPLQMACAYMGIANKGTIWRPHLLKGVRKRSGSGLVSEFKPEAALSPQESDANYEVVHAGLEGVIYEESASMAAHFNNLDVRVQGKTGTGEHGEEPTAWFCCYAPAENPKYVVAAVIDQGGFGSTSAMYTARDVLGTIYDQPDDVETIVNDGTR